MWFSNFGPVIATQGIARKTTTTAAQPQGEKKEMDGDKALTEAKAVVYIIIIIVYAG